MTIEKEIAKAGQYELSQLLKSVATEYATRFDPNRVMEIASNACVQAQLEKSSIIEKYNLTDDDDLHDLLKTIEYVVMVADREVTQRLWLDFAEDSNVRSFIGGDRPFPGKTRYSWKNNNGDPLVTIGKFMDRHICISLTTAIINDMKVMFVECTSMLVDHSMVEEWVKKHLTCKDSNGRHAVCDSSNFIHAIWESEKKKELSSS